MHGAYLLKMEAMYELWTPQTCRGEFTPQEVVKSHRGGGEQAGPASMWDVECICGSQTSALAAAHLGMHG